MNEQELIRSWIVWKESTEGPSFSQRKLAENAGISPTYLSSILTGARNAGTKTIERIAAAVGVSVSEFYGGPPDGFTVDAPFPEPPLSMTPPDAPVKASAPRTASAPPQYDPPQDRTSAAADETGLKFAGVSSNGLDRLFDSFGFSLGESFPGQPEPEPPGYEPPEPSGTVTSDGVSQREPPKYEPPEPSGTVAADGVPVLVRAPSGHWRDWLDEERRVSGERLPVLMARSGPLFAVRMEDRSMSPKFEEGTCLVVDPEVLFDRFDGGVGVVVHGGKFIVRHVYSVGGFFILVPSNPAYYPRVVSADKTQVFRIALSVHG